MQELNNTNFCSVYGSSSYFEDFAEAYTIYVHTILMKKPYSLKLYQNNKLIQIFENPFKMKNFQKKKEYIEKLIKVTK